MTDRRVLKVVRVITRLNIGGPAIQAMRLTSDLARFGYDTTLVHGRVGASEGDMGYLLHADGARVIHLQTLRRPIAPVDDVRAFLGILAVLRAVKPDIVHTHMAKAGVLGRIATLVYNRTAGRAHPARTVHTYHGHVLEGYFSSIVAKGFVAVERWLSRGTDVLVAVSPRIRDELAGTFAIAPRDRFAVVPLGFDLETLSALDDGARARSRAALGISPTAAVITTVGRLTAIKNHTLLLDAARRIAASTPDALFLIAGDGELRGDLERYAASVGLADRVRFLGWRRDLANIYGATDVFVLTSRNEGTPVALIEAMAAGVAAVATDVGGVADVVADASLGTLVRADDSSGIASAIEELINRKDAARAMGERARASVVARYGLARLVSDIDAQYRSLI